eukprot:2808272-Amphidinium_carterae.1
MSWALVVRAQAMFAHHLPQPNRLRCTFCQCDIGWGKPTFGAEDVGASAGLALQSYSVCSSS